jgi:hypothetical protein
MFQPKKPVQDEYGQIYEKLKDDPNNLWGGPKPIIAPKVAPTVGPKPITTQNVAPAVGPKPITTPKVDPNNLFGGPKPIATPGTASMNSGNPAAKFLVGVASTKPRPSWEEAEQLRLKRMQDAQARFANKQATRPF